LSRPANTRQPKLRLTLAELTTTMRRLGSGGFKYWLTRRHVQ
jgi:hypothetical protein